MWKRSALLASISAGVLTLGVVATAMAVVLTEDHEAVMAGWDAGGDPFAEDKFGDPFPFNQAACSGFGVEVGEIVIHFVQSETTPNPGGTSANLLDVDLNDGEIFLSDQEASAVAATSVEWLVSVFPPGPELEIVSADSDVDEGELVIEHLCIGPLEGATEPGTDTLSPAQEANPGEGLWLLVLALGVLLTSIVVATPARGRNTR